MRTARAARALKAVEGGSGAAALAGACAVAFLVRLFSVRCGCELKARRRGRE
jgi:hypothetical protein